MNSFMKLPPGECFTKTKIDFKLDLTMAGRSCHCLRSPFTAIGLSRDVQNNHGHKSTDCFISYNSLLKENII